MNARLEAHLLHPGLHLLESDAVTDDEKPRLGRRDQDGVRRVDEEVVALGPPDVCDEPDHRRAAESELVAHGLTRDAGVELLGVDTGRNRDDLLGRAARGEY